MTDLPDGRALGERLQQIAEATPRQALPALIGILEAAKAVAWSRLADIVPAQSTGAEPLVTAEELAPLVKLPVHAVRDRARRGLIPSVPLGRYVRFQASAVIAALKGESRIANPGATKKPHNVKRLRAQCPPSVQDASEAHR